MMRDKVPAFLLATLFPIEAAVQESLPDAASLRIANDVLSANMAPCGEITRTVRDPDGNLIVDCSNGAAYMIVQFAGRTGLLRYNAAISKWGVYP